MGVLKRFNTTNIIGGAPQSLHGLCGTASQSCSYPRPSHSSTLSSSSLSSSTLSPLSAFNLFYRFKRRRILRFVSLCGVDNDEIIMRVPTTLLLHIPPSLAHDAHQALLVADETGAGGHSYERTSSSHSPSAVIYLSRRPSAQHSWYSQVKQEFGTRLCSYNQYLAGSIPFIFTPQTVSQKSQRFFFVRATDMDDHLNSHPDNRRVDFYIFFLQRRL